MNKEDIQKSIESLKGISPASPVLARAAELLSARLLTMEPGDLAGRIVSASPAAYDLWYLWYHKNFLKIYYEDSKDADFNHYDYSAYLNSSLSFLDYLAGLKPLKVLMDIKQLRIDEVWLSAQEYYNNGIYWINSLFFEFIIGKTSLKYPSAGSKGYRKNVNDYVGYIAFPIGQLGIMEVISLVQETDLRGYAFSKYTGDANYHAKPALTILEDKDKPTIQSTPEMFPDMKDSNGNALAGQNYCYGRHLIEFAYYKPETGLVSSEDVYGRKQYTQNILNSEKNTAYAPIAGQDVELWADNIKDYGENIKPKLWMRYWIHKDSTLPVPGEFIGILVRPVAAPPHVWWFQESAPFLYAGNWVETRYLTSGIITGIVLEENRTDGGIGNQYSVTIQGVNIVAYASDFYRYSIGDRVAILKTSSMGTATESYTSLNQTHFKEKDEKTISLVHMIVPATFYKLKH